MPPLLRLAGMVQKCFEGDVIIGWIYGRSIFSAGARCFVVIYFSGSVGVVLKCVAVGCRKGSIIVIFFSCCAGFSGVACGNAYSSGTFFICCE